MTSEREGTRSGATQVSVRLSREDEEHLERVRRGLGDGATRSDAVRELVRRDREARHGG